jgi:hypothetical protein
MLKEPIELFEQFRFVDKITTSIEDKYLKKEWPYRHGLGIARIEDEDCLYTFSLRVHRTSLQWLKPERWRPDGATTAALVLVKGKYQLCMTARALNAKPADDL